MKINMTKTTEQFIIEAKDIHGDKFDYSKVIYINNKSKVFIGCKIHGFFEQRSSSHLEGNGCHNCLKENRNPYKCKENFYLEKFVNIGNKLNNYKYDYSLVKYEKGNKKVEIICPEHGIFLQAPTEHKRGRGCPKCSGRYKTNEEFIKSCEIVHQNKYNYSLCKYLNARSIVKIICTKHGEFNQKAIYHISGNGCPNCKESFGEKIIRNFLVNSNINFIPQKRFKECKNVYTLPFDFYLTDYNICVEYNGIQHYKSFDWFGGENAFLDRLKRDKIKKEYCEFHNIPLIIINYLEIKQIEDILTNHIKFINT